MFWVGLTAGYILGGVSGLAVFSWIFGTREDGKADARADQAEATVEALHRANEGRNEAVADLRKGKTPTEIKAKNDKAWGKTSAKSAEAIRSASQARKAALERLAKR